MDAIWAVIRRVPSYVTALGWNVAGLGLVSAVLGMSLGWHEFDVIASGCALMFLIAGGFLFGRADLETRIELSHGRVTVGEPATAHLAVHNRSSRRSGRLTIEVPITRDGQLLHAEPVRIQPLDRDGNIVSKEFPLPTGRRGVVELGPASVVRADPIGLLRREATWSGVREFFVHPRTTAIGPTGAGFMRDLEGQASKDLSMNDVAFHALREYEPGDSLRHVHALTSARLGKLMVRQFTDTRAAHLTVIVSGVAADYRDVDEEFETALSIGSSLALRALHDEQQVSVLAAGYAGPTPRRVSHRVVLDGFSRARIGVAASGLVSLATQAMRVAPDTSLAALVGGTPTSIDQFRLAAARFGPGVQVVGVHVVAGAKPYVRRAGRIHLLTVPHLRDLALAMRQAVRT